MIPGDGGAARVRGGEAIEGAIRRAGAAGRPALAPFVTAGHPDPERFDDLLRAVARVADVVEIGVPFSDPMADGVTVQRASRVALERGVTLPWILDTIGRVRPAAPVVLMSYLNPLLAHGVAGFVREAVDAGVAGVIVPDLPLEEAAEFEPTFASAGLAAIRLVSPVTPDERLRRLADGARGFLYAVTVTGTTGGALGARDGLATYLDRVRAVADVPVLAGFGVRSADDLAAIARHADGAIVGSALIEEIERGGDPEAFLRRLRTEATA